MSKYKEVRGSIHNGDILLCSGNYPMSNLIRKISNSLYSHVGFVMWIHDRLMVLESVENIGVRTVPLSSYLNDYSHSEKAYDGDIYIGRHQNLYELLTNDATIKDVTAKLMGIALDLMGKRYDIEDLSKIALRLTLGIGHRDPDDAYICSEYIEACFASIGIRFGDIGGFVLPKNIGEDPNVDICFRLN
ncbi:YiiX/YebB-like N1pC/P60 family cysteine hydrolase [Paenibacillus sp. LjRoot153]|uniref:YiiX/YebB-like N1pC/P60 family cysteine hydrolase n=1 Tax=Paenibacillus sp. LjRoot153 TaxID=3342270 RepID=UPI003F4F4797